MAEQVVWPGNKSHRVSLEEISLDVIWAFSSRIEPDTLLWGYEAAREMMWISDKVNITKTLGKRGGLKGKKPWEWWIEHVGISMDSVTGPSRKAPLCRIRQIISAIADECEYHPTEIAAQLGKHRTSVFHYRKAHETDLPNPIYRIVYENARAALKIKYYELPTSIHSTAE